tara:strand:- start:515 stop:775 length:261 start_codon:yes stop_codon:yes gene_type:complete
MGEFEFHAVWVSKEHGVIAFHIVILCRSIQDLNTVVEQELLQSVNVFSTVRAKGKMMQAGCIAIMAFIGRIRISRREGDGSMLASP